MRGISALGLCAALVACASPSGQSSRTATLATPPPAPSNESALRVEPITSVVQVGQAATLRVRGHGRSKAQCSWSKGSSKGPSLSIGPPANPGVVDVVCTSAGHRAEAQVTFTDAALHPVTDPYAGGVALFKLRKQPDGMWDPLGRRDLGLGSTDRLLEDLGAYAFPAFPFDRAGTRDRSGIGRWIVVDIPEGVNFYQAVELLRSDANVHAESYLPEDGTFVRVHALADWPVPLAVARPRDRGMVKLPSIQAASFEADRSEASVGWELLEIGAPEAWTKSDGRGVGIAIVDTGVDIDHVAVRASLRTKPYEGSGNDSDQNGLPGDHWGANFAHLAIVHGGGTPRLATGLFDVSDWDGALSGRSRKRWGHGTALAAIAAAPGESGTRIGVAPGAWILPVDVQENLKPRRSKAGIDPRMRARPKSGSGRPLRASPWSRALGVAYATAEGARVLTCAWPSEEPHWILRDALAYAEENCTVAVCSVVGTDSAESGFPGAWRESWLRAHDAGTGDVYDAWSGERVHDFFPRPLRGLLLVDPLWGPSPHDHSPDLLAPTRPRRGHGGVTSAVSRPANDAGDRTTRDRGTASFAGPGVAAGLTAGTAALVSSRRPDLDPASVAEALRGPEPGAEPPRLSAPAALETAIAAPRGRCRAPDDRPRMASDEPIWRRVKAKVKYEKKSPGAGAPPPLPEEGE